MTCYTAIIISGRKFHFVLIMPAKDLLGIYMSDPGLPW